MLVRAAGVARSKTAIWLLREAVTKAGRLANTTSAGSSWTRRVSRTARRETEITLMLSETSFTTHASSLLSGWTETGSRPTGISAIRIGFWTRETSKTETRLSGVLTANRREPSGERRTGLVCLASKLTKFYAERRSASSRSMAEPRAQPGADHGSLESREVMGFSEQQRMTKMNKPHGHLLAVGTVCGSGPIIPREQRPVHSSFRRKCVRRRGISSSRQ